MHLAGLDGCGTTGIIIPAHGSKDWSTLSAFQKVKLINSCRTIGKAFLDLLVMSTSLMPEIFMCECMEIRTFMRFDARNAVGSQQVTCGGYVPSSSAVVRLKRFRRIKSLKAIIMLISIRVRR